MGWSSSMLKSACLIFEATPQRPTSTFGHVNHEIAGGLCIALLPARLTVNMNAYVDAAALSGWTRAGHATCCNFSMTEGICNGLTEAGEICCTVCKMFACKMFHCIRIASTNMYPTESGCIFFIYLI